MKIIGVGGAGKNAVNHMVEIGVPGVDFLVANTDAQDLAGSNVKHKIQLGREITRGLGAGANPDIGRKAAEESRDDIAEHLTDIDMVFITAGMGGGTGSGAAPVIAQIAKDLGVLAVGIVTKPFAFEGPKRAANAETGLAALKEYVDTVVIIPNQKLKEAVSHNTSFKDALKVADEVLLQATRGISDLVTLPGLINVDFADIKTTMENKGAALMGTGEAVGDKRALEAAEQAMKHPLLEDMDIDGARDILLNISGGQDMTLFEVEEVMTTGPGGRGPHQHHHGHGPRRKHRRQHPGDVDRHGSGPGDGFPGRYADPEHPEVPAGPPQRDRNPGFFSASSVTVSRRKK